MAHSPKPPMAQQTSAGPSAGGVDLCAWAVQYEPALRRYFSRRAHAADIDDLVQEVFLMLQARGAESEIENVEGYLFRTARRRWMTTALLAMTSRRSGFSSGRKPFRPCSRR